MQLSTVYHIKMYFCTLQIENKKKHHKKAVGYETDKN